MSTMHYMEKEKTMMVKKEYIAPAAEFIEMDLVNVFLLGISDTQVDPEDGVWTKENDRTGDWDNIWNN